MYPASFEIATRFGDMDPGKHINNVAVARLYEECRVRFHRTPVDDESVPLVVAQVNLHYIGETTYPDPVVICVGTAHIGRTSFSIGQALFQGGTCVGLSDTTAVHVIEGVATPLPAFFVSYLEEFRLRTG